MRPVSGAVLLATCALALAACGDGPKPEAIARDYVASNAASKCDVLAPALVEQLTGERGAAALAACHRNVVRFPAPRSVRIDSVKAAGGDPGQAGDSEAADEAEVRLIADGKEAELKLQKEAGTWQIVQLGE